MNTNNEVGKKQSNADDFLVIEFKRIFNKLTEYWYLVILSLLVCLSLAFIYVNFTPPIYEIKAKVLINGENGGGMSQQSGALMDLGGMMGSSNSVDNEVEILKTRFLLEKVVREMKLNIIYSEKIGIATKELSRPPFILSINEGEVISNALLEISVLDEQRLKVASDDFEKIIRWGEMFSLPNVGNVRLHRNDNSNSSGRDFEVKLMPVDNRVNSLMSQLTVNLSNKQVTIIDLGLLYSLPDKGEDILNTLISKYAMENLRDKNTIADSTYKFIKERLNVIATELGDVENEVESFKQRNTLADMTEQGKLLVQKTEEFTTDLAKAETQVAILEEIEKYLNDDTNNKRVFPSSLVSQDLVFSNLMNLYNSLLIERDRQLLSVTKDSPFIKNLDEQILGLRKGILSNFQNTKKAVVATRDQLKGQLNSAMQSITGVPQIEKNYLKLARNQEIKQELYIFLMQKAEETAISKTANISIAKTIDPPKSNPTPISPKRSIAYLIAFFVGLIIPIAVFFIIVTFDDKINTKEDVLQLTEIPIIGEISHDGTGDNIIVANKGRSSISEQFRALRTNLSFFLPNDDQKIILITSSMSGEGKSFTAINLGLILAISGKKVLLMEMDLRKPGISSKLHATNPIGFSNYIVNSDITVQDLIKPTSVDPNLYLITSGPLPPNPAELILKHKTGELIDKLKGEFDYIIMDAPPVGIVADAQLLAGYADTTLYLIRQGTTKKDQIAIAQELYVDKKMVNMGIVVNDIENKHYGYGYGYGNYGE